MEIRANNTANWFTEAGIWKKKRQIQSKGLPNVNDARFITCTIDPLKFSSELEAYLAGREKLRRFISAVRDIVGEKVPGCWKFEFQDNGWPHWHFIFLYKKKLTLAQLKAVSDAWAFGRVEVQRAKNGGAFDYLFKYVFKHPGKNSQTVPDWFLDYFEVIVCEKTGEKRAKSMQRVRFFQTFGDFYTGKKKEIVVEEKEQQTCLLVFPLRQHLEWSERSVTVICRDHKGDYLKSKVLQARCSLRELFRFLNLLTLGGVATSPRPMEYLVAVKQIEDKILWQDQMHKMDRQTIKRLPINQPF